MDDSMEDEIICELFSAHAHILWKYVRVTSSFVSEMVLSSPSDGIRKNLLQIGPLMAVTLVIVLMSVLVQGGFNGWFQNFLVSCQRSVYFKVPDPGLKNLVSAAINSESVSQELQEGIVGVYALQGRRGTMEDRYCVQQNVSVSEEKRISFYGVYDGHGGQYVAEYVKQNLFSNTIEKIKELHKLKPCNRNIPNGIKASANSSTATKRRHSSFATTNSTAKASQPDRRQSLNTDAFNAHLDSIKENLDKIQSDIGNLKTNKASSTQSTSSNDECPKGSTNSGTSVSESSSSSLTISKTGASTTCKSNGGLSSKITNGASISSTCPSVSYKDACIVEELSNKGDDPSKDSQCLKKEDPYSNIATRKRNSVAPSSDSNSNKDQEANCDASSDYLYVDSQKNINYTRLLTDQINNIDTKVVEHCKNKGDFSGTTAVIAILDGDLLIIGNVGDSRAVMADTKGATIPLSFDHKPNQLKERRRIKEAGGFITFTGVWRVAGILATSRAVGDFPLKDPKKLITAEPDVLTFSLKEHKAHFVILATDGLWDVITNEEAVAFIQRHIHEKDFGAKSLALHAYDRGSQDNITVTVINIGKLVI